MIALLAAAALAAPRSANDQLVGRWAVDWELPGSGPKHFTGTLDLHRNGPAWYAALWFDQTGQIFTFDQGEVEKGTAHLVWWVFDSALEMKVSVEDGGLTGQATWHGSTDWSPIRGERGQPPPEPVKRALVPIPFDSPPGDIALVPTTNAPGPWPGLPLDTSPPAGPLEPVGPPQLSADGSVTVFLEPYGNHCCRLSWASTASPEDRHPVRDGLWGLRWWRVAPDSTGVVCNGLDNKLSWLNIDGVRTDLCGDAAIGVPTWIDLRWAQREVWFAVPNGDDGLRVSSCDLEGHDPVEIVSHPTADDVVFDADGHPRLWLERTKPENVYDFDTSVDVWSPYGQRWGDPFRQVTWIEDLAPQPRFGSGPVTLLGGGEFSWLGTVDERGFTQADVPPQVWADATHVVTDPVSGAVDAVAWWAERLHWEAVGDPTVADDLHFLEDQLGGDVTVAQRSLNDAWWVVTTWSGSAQRTSVLFRRADRRIVQLDPLPEEDPQLPAGEALVLTARDGDRMAAYLTKPDPSRWGPPPWPTIVQVHGGPWSGRHGWYPDPQASGWADRGYATLQVNFRGTYGFGLSRVSGDDAAWGRGMIDDVDDAITWAIDEGWAEPDRVAMVGASYGGYAALQFATSEVPRVACVSAGLTPGNLMVQDGHLRIEAVGDRKWRLDHSADRHTHRLTGPALVWTGGRDALNPDSIHTFVKNAERDGKDVTWVRFPWEGHGLENPANRDALRAIEDHFLGACLDGASEPYPSDFAEAWLEVVSGEEHVPGLADHVAPPIR